MLSSSSTLSNSSGRTRTSNSSAPSNSSGRTRTSSSSNAPSNSSGRTRTSSNSTPQQQQRQDQNKQQNGSTPSNSSGRIRTSRQQRAQQRDNEQPQRTQEQQRVLQSAWQQHRSQRWDSDHRTWQQRGGYHGYRIPDDRFRGYFGPDHGFRIYGLPFLVVGGYPRFQYQGYWISLVDPWPEYWGNDWYDNDDVYVMYVDNGYYLFNRRYPQTGIAISISIR